MKPVWMVIAAVTLGATFAVTTRISAYARETDFAQDKWAQTSTAMTTIYGEDWYNKMTSSYITNHTAWTGMKKTYLVVIHCK